MDGLQQQQHTVNSEYSAVPLQEEIQREEQEQEQGADSLREFFWPAGIASLTIQIPESRRKPASKGQQQQLQQLPRWKSREFYIYYAIVLVALYKVIEAPIRLSSGALD